MLAVAMTLRRNFFTFVIYNFLIGLLTIAMMWYCNSLISSYLIKAEQSGQVPSELLNRLLILGEIGTFITFFPAILLGSFFTLWQLGTEPSPPTFEPLKTLIRKSSSASILLGAGWMHAIVKAANPIFLVLVFLCISGFLSGKYQNEWLDISLAIINAIWISLLLLKLSTLITLPWLALDSKAIELRRSNLQIKDGATWLMLINCTLAITLMMVLHKYLRIDNEQTDITYQLLKQAINFYVPQPFLWFIAMVAREYAVLVPRKPWIRFRFSSKN